MSKLRKKYTKAEKLEIVKLSLSEEVQVTDLADRFGVAANTIYNWRSRYYKEQGITTGGQGVKKLSEEERQIADLKKPNPFITNDNPGATLVKDDRIVNTQFSDWYAFSFPISPDFMFMILNQDDHSLFAHNRIKVVEHRTIDKEFVGYANKACIHNANEMIISNSKAVLEDLKKQYHQFYVMPRKGKK